MRHIELVTRRPFPLGRPRIPKAIIYRAADRPRRLVYPNRYPGQWIGVCVRLRNDGKHGHPILSIVWARPSRWWT